jgi:1-phosphatidylinositol-4-phosphate 5-kinase
MFYSMDERYIVKTTSKAELDKLLQILSSYVSYLEQNPLSFLCKIVGAHCIMMYGKKIHFIVMVNFIPKTAHNLREIYDLKGGA